MDTKANKIPPELHQQDPATIPGKGNALGVDTTPTATYIITRLMQLKAKLEAFEENPLRFKNSVKSKAI